MEKIISIMGLIFIIIIAYLLSEKKKAIDWKLVATGIGLQLLFALIILKTSPGLKFFDWARLAITQLISFSNQGAEFLFGKLVSDYNIGAIMAFQVLPIIIFISALSAILYHFGIIQFVVKIMAKIMHRVMRISGAESLSAALFVFMGIESLAIIRAYIEKMTRSEIFTLMTAFMATIAGSVMAAYVSFGAEAGHLLAASIMSAPAAIIISKIMIPETGTPVTKGKVQLEVEKKYINTVEAAASGSIDGLKLAVNIGAMLMAFISLIFMANFLLGFLHKGINLSLEFSNFAYRLPEGLKSLPGILGYLFSPLAVIMGIPPGEALSIGQLLGTKVVLNEFLAYRELQTILQTLNPRTAVIATYALCSFANLGSIAIITGGIGSIAPSRRHEIARLGIKALIAGNLAGFTTATIAGILF